MNIPPLPVLELTYEQQYAVIRLEKDLSKADRETIIQAVLSAQRSNYMLTNTITNLLKNWPNDNEAKS